MSHGLPSRIAKVLARVLLMVLTMLGALAYSMQDRLLHYPEAIEAAAALALAQEQRLAPWPDAAAPLGWLRESAPTTTTPRGTIVLFHGNGGHALHRGWFADELERHGYRILLAEYPGYGHRTGATDEATLVDEAARLIASLRKQTSGRLILAGESLGAGVASAALAQLSANGASPGIDAIWLITPWNNLASVAGHHYPLLPVRLVLRDRYDSAANLKDFKGPKLVLVAGRDSIIPPELAHRLFDALGSHKMLIELPLSDHNDWVDAMNPGQWQAAVEFLEGKAPTARNSSAP